MAKIVRFHRLGGPEVLQLDELDLPAPRAGEVRIRVEALGLNRAETLFRTGHYIEQAVFPSGLGLEAAGVIDEVGPQVKGWATGDRVTVVPPVSMKQRPVHGEQLLYPANAVLRTPASLCSIEAAATWMAFLTAYGGLFDIARVTPDDHVVITAASSSVGLAALQLSRLAGATPIAITRTETKRAALIEAGAAHVVAVNDKDIAEAIGSITRGRGARVLFDAVGGAFTAPLAAAAAVEGIIINYGALDVKPTMLPPATLLAKSLTLRGYLVHEVTQDLDRLSAATTKIFAGLASGELKPAISRVFPLQEIADAYRFLESNEQIGKVVVTV